MNDQTKDIKPWQIRPSYPVKKSEATLGFTHVTDCYVGGRGDIIMNVAAAEPHPIVGIEFRNLVIMPVEQLALDVGDELFAYAEAAGTLPDVMQWIHPD